MVISIPSQLEILKEVLGSQRFYAAHIYSLKNKSKISFKTAEKFGEFEFVEMVDENGETYYTPSYYVDENSEYFGKSLQTNELPNSSETAIGFTADSTGTIVLEYRMSSEPSWDVLVVFVNGELVLLDSGSTPWKTFNISVKDGDRVYIAFRKDYCCYLGNDTVFIKELKFINETLPSEPMITSYSFGPVAIYSEGGYREMAIEAYDSAGA